MHYVFLLLRLYPYWALPVSILFGQLGMFFRRHDNKLQWVCFGAVGFFVITTVLWAIGRGDLHSDAWVRSIIAHTNIFDRPANLA
jgi:hypothetical protein